MGRPIITIFRVLDTVVKSEEWFIMNDMPLAKLSEKQFINIMLLEEITVSRRKALDLFETMLDLDFCKRINQSDTVAFDLSRVFAYQLRKANDDARPFYESIIEKRKESGF